MATGIVRAVLCSFLADTSSENVSTMYDVSERGRAAKESVQSFMGQLTEEATSKEFDSFATTLVSTISECICTTISSTTTCRSKEVLREKLWRSFHQVRVKVLVDLWKKFYTAIGREKLDPLIEQQVNLRLFEDKLKTHLKVHEPSQQITTSPSLKLSPEEENILRYAAGYVSLSLLKRYELESSEEAAEYCECLNQMAVNGDESSLLAYTLEWTRAVNRGGLFEINDVTFLLFGEIEVKMQKHLLSTLKSSLSTSGKREFIVNTVASDQDVQFVWSLLSNDIQDEEHAVHLLKEIVALWLTIRGFSIAKTWIEQYKRQAQANTKKGKGLRKDLKKKAESQGQSSSK